VLHPITDLEANVQESVKTVLDRLQTAASDGGLSKEEASVMLLTVERKIRTAAERTARLVLMGSQQDSASLTASVAATKFRMSLKANLSDHEVERLSYLVEVKAKEAAHSR
jgi:hypothetical protein